MSGMGIGIYYTYEFIAVCLAMYWVEWSGRMISIMPRILTYD
jgi:hypothetical protein